MTPSRRTLLGGLLASLAAPAIIRTPGLLMPVRVGRAPPMLIVNDLRSIAQRFQDAERFAQQAWNRMQNDMLFYGQACMEVDARYGIVRTISPSEFAASGRTA